MLLMYSSLNWSSVYGHLTELVAQLQSRLVKVAVGLCPYRAQQTYAWTLN
jgi:hypothetical protein